MTRALLLLFVAATASAGPLPRSFKPLGASKTWWISPAMPLADADKTWRAIADTPGYVALIFDESPAADDEPQPGKPLTLAAARVSLAKRRKAEHDVIIGVLAKHPEIPADEARTYRAEWTGWSAQLAKATISADDRNDAADTLADDARGLDFDDKPKQFYVIAIAGSVDNVIAAFEGYNGSPGGAELAPLLATWKKAYGARPYAWDGYQLTLDVPRPPTKLADVRALAADFALACPYERSGRGTIGLGESPGHVMARLQLKRWVCYWFEE